MSFVFNKLSGIGLAFCLILLNIGCSSTKHVLLSINYLEPYCGGARPTIEMEKDAQTLKPCIRKKVFYVSGKGVVDSVTTNEFGSCKIKLKSGVYNFYEEWRFKKQSPNGAPLDQFDKACLKTEWAFDFLVLTIDGTTILQKGTNTISNYCPHNMPCMLDNFKPPLPE